jgi:type IV pilus assembly protein PilY1
LSTGVTVADNGTGWLYDLTGTAPGTGGATERIVVDPDAIAGIFAINWATVIPTSDPCSLQGAIYSANFGSGKSDLLDSSGGPLPFLTTQTATTNLQYVQLPSGQFVLLYGQTGQQAQTANVVQPGTSPTLLRTNWREITN